MNGETSREEKTPNPSSSTPASPPTEPDENWIEELGQKYRVSILDYKLSMYRAEIAEARAESRINMRALIREVWHAASVRAAIDTEPTVEDGIGLLRKLEGCTSDAAKLILLKNFVLRSVRAASTGTGSRIEELESACALLRAQIERAEKVLNKPSPPVASQKGKEEE